MPESVGTLMAPAVVTLGPTSTIEAARALMQAHDVHALPVVDDEDQPVGMLTSTDLVPELPSTLPVSRVMTRAVLEVGPDTEPETAAKAMVEHRVHHLVVMKDGRLVGILSALDLLSLVRSRPRPRSRRK